MSKKSKLWDNSSLQEDIQWGNIELPGLPDEELYKKNWNRDAGNREAAISRKNNIYWKENIRKGMKDLLNNPSKLKEYKEKFHKGNNEKYNNPKFWEAYYAGIAIRDSNPEYHKKRIAASNEKKAIKIQTPDGVFDSISDAARHYGLTSEGMRYRVQSKKYPDFIKIDKDKKSKSP